jgi:excisionase family DNA binding protein
MSDQLTRALARQLAQDLPGALDDQALAILAARLRPYLGRELDGQRPDDRLLTAAEAAARARVHVETIRRAIRAGDLCTAGRVGRSPRISIVALDAWLRDTDTVTQTGTPIRRRRRRSSAAPNAYSLRVAFGDAATDAL